MILRMSEQVKLEDVTSKKEHEERSQQDARPTG
jgi:hypothetical protein